MEEQLAILVNQVLLFTTFIAIGFVFQRIKLFTEANIQNLSETVVRVLLPMMILTVIPSSGTREELLGMLPFVLGVVIMYLILFLLGILSAKLLRLKQPTKNIHIAMAGFTNSGFMGFPLLLAMFPKEAPVAFVPYAFLESILLWGKFKYLTELPKETKEPFHWKKLISPVNVSLVIAVLMMLLGIRPSGPIWEGMSAIGGTCKYMALLYIGGIIGVKGFGALLKRKEAFSLVPIKLIIAPLLVFFIVGALHILSPEYLLILTIFSMLPCMVVIAILAENNGSDGDYAIAALLSTVLCSLVTMPLVMWILTTLFY